MRGIREFIQSLREIYNAVPEAILITDLKGKIVFLNTVLLNYNDITEKTWLNKSISSFLSNYNHSKRLKQLQKDKTVIEEVNLMNSSKKAKGYKCLNILLETDEEAIGQIFILHLNEPSLNQNHYSNKSNPIVQVLNARKNEIWFISDFHDYLTLFCSDSIKQICGWTSEEFELGGWAFSFIMMHPLDRAKTMELLMTEMALRNKKKIIYDQVPMVAKFRFRTKSNTWVWFEDKLSVLDRDEDGNVKYIIGSITKFVPEDENQKLKAIQLLENNVLFKNGKTFINLDTLLEIQKSNIQNQASHSEVLVDSFHLSNRELEVLSLIVQGFSSDEIGDKIHITKNTVNMHRKQIMKKMQAKNLADLVRKSVENGLFLKRI